MLHKRGLGCGVLASSAVIAVLFLVVPFILSAQSNSGMCLKFMP